MCQSPSSDLTWSTRRIKNCYTQAFDTDGMVQDDLLETPCQKEMFSGYPGGMMALGERRKRISEVDISIVRDIGTPAVVRWERLKHHR